MGDFNQSKYINDFIKETYDTIKVQVPKGQKELIKEHAKKKGFKSVNEYMKDLIAPGIFADILYNTVFGFNPVPGGKTAGHGDGRINNIAVAAGSLAFNDFYFIAGTYQTGAFHFKFNGSHVF